MKYRKSRLLILTLVVMCQLVVSVSSKSALALTTKGNEVKKNKTEDNETKKENQREGELLIKFKPGTSVKEKSVFFAKHELVFVRNYKALNIDKVSIKKDQTIEKVIENIKKETVVTHVEEETSARISWLELRQDGVPLTGNPILEQGATSWALEYGVVGEFGENLNYIQRYPGQTPANGPNDPLFSDQWNLNNTGANFDSSGWFLPRGVTKEDFAGNDLDILNAWTLTSGSPDVVVAVVDTGVDYTHEDLAANIWTNDLEIPGNGIDDDGNGYIDDVHGIDTANHDSDPIDDNGHGTFMSGIIGAAANNGVGIAGIAPNVKILPCKAFYGYGEGFVSSVAECLDYIKVLKDRGVNIVATNNSYHFLAPRTSINGILWDAIITQKERGILFIASAGQKTYGGPIDNGCLAGGDLANLHAGGYRSGNCYQTHPAAYSISNILSAEATFAFDNKIWWAHYGKRNIHIGAPGGRIVSTVPGGYIASDGSSMAAPHIAGIAALLKSLYPAMTWKEVKNRILAGGDETEITKNVTISGKRANAYKALTCTDSTVLTALKYPFVALPWVPTYAYAWLQDIIIPGNTYTFSALSINCENPVGPVKVDMFGDGGSIIRSIELLDNGITPDEVAGDGIFSAKWTALDNSAKSFTITSPAGIESNLGTPVQADWKIVEWAEAAHATIGNFLGFVDLPSAVETGQVLTIGTFTRNIGEQGLLNHLAVLLSVDDVMNYALEEPCRSKDSNQFNNNGEDTCINMGGWGGTSMYYNGPGSFGEVGNIPVVIPPYINSGLYYWSPVVGTENFVYDFEESQFNPGDANPSNNVSAVPVTINHVESDLIFTNFTAPTNVLSGGKTAVTFTFKNAGPTGKIWQNFDILPYLSIDQTITTADMLMGQWQEPLVDPLHYSAYRGPGVGNGGGISAINPIDVNEEVTGTANVRIPYDLQTGTYYIGVTIGSRIWPHITGLIVNEVNTANNFSAVIPITVTEAHPDLIVTSATTDKSAWVTGVKERVSYSIKNQGLIDALGHHIAIYISTDPVITTSDITIGEGWYSGLAAGVETEKTFYFGTDVTVPNTVLSGTYYVGVIVDNRNAIIESDLSNNIAAGEGNNSFLVTQITITQMQPDLKLSAFSAPASTVTGASISVPNTVMNQGIGISGSSNLDFYLSTDAVINTADIYLGQRAVGTLTAGSSGSAVTSLTIPVTVAAGSYYIGAIADATGSNFETDETNNTASSVIYVTSGIDLIVSEYLAPASTATGVAISVSNTVKNQGIGKSDSSTVNFYLSTDAVITTADTYLGHRSVNPLTAGSSSIAATSLSIPVTIAAGNYYIGVISDATSTNLETDETNNTASSAITIISGIDFIVSSFSAPAIAVTGTSISVPNTVTNQGFGKAVSSYLKFYLSTDAEITTSDIYLGQRSISSLASGLSSGATTSISLPVTIAAGNYYIGAIADATATNLETDETNNIALSAITITSGVDFAVSSFSAPASAYTGASISVPNTVTNQGSGTAVASYLKFYLSTDADITTSDLYLTQRSISSLASGALSSATTNISIPVTIAAGNYYIGAIADATATNLETDETNNIALSAITITIGVDFVVSEFSAPASAYTGTSISVPNTVTNQGSGTAVASSLRFYLSIDADITTSDIYLTQRSVGTLASGALSSVTTNISIPVTIAAGSYYIGAISDATGTNPETNETNNIALSAISITSGVDFVVSEFNAPASAYTGTSISVPNTVTNQGSGTAVASYLKFYLSTDADITTSDIYLTRRSVGTLASGALSSATKNISIPVTIAAGSYYIGAISDATGTNPETNETNNIALSAITITSGVDFVVSEFSAPASAYTGTSISVPNTVTNQGSGSAVSSYLKFYLSTDAEITTSDTYLTQRFVGALGAGLWSSATTNISLPVTIAVGSYYVGAIVDGTATIPETDETNNIALSAITITSGVDFAVSSFSVPASAYTGTSISVPNTVTNQGSGTSVSSRLRFYLSTDAEITTTDIFLIQRSISSLASGLSSSATTSISLPVTIGAGNYYIGAIADATATNPETDETNNIALSAITITSGVDFAVSSFSAPASAVTGTSISVPNTVTNQGSGTAVSSYLKFYLSPDAEITTSDTYLTQRSISSLASGLSSSATTSISLPVTIAAGSYYIGAIADATATNPETDETNNIALSAITITSGVDFAVSSFSVPASAVTGTSISVPNTVTNQGSGTAVSSYLKFYLSPDAEITTSDTYLTQRSISSLASGLSSSTTTSISLPVTIAAGSYYIGAISDATATNPETDETNNIALSAITITSGVDFVVSSFSVPASAYTGTSISVPNTVTNQGSGTSVSSRLRFYLSTDAEITTTDIFLIQRSISSLASGLSSSATTSISLPVTIAAGSYYIGAIADATATNLETDETNNIASSAITVSNP